jgi:hypothetical protein
MLIFCIKNRNEGGVSGGGYSVSSLPGITEKRGVYAVFSRFFELFSRAAAARACCSFDEQSKCSVLVFVIDTFVRVLLCPERL